MGTDIRVLEQIVYNLFADALKRSYSGIVRIEGGPRRSLEGNRVHIAISDSAPPLTEELLSRFLSTGGPGGREAVGPGLELLVARLLAERLGGTLCIFVVGRTGPVRAGPPLGDRMEDRWPLRAEGESLVFHRALRREGRQAGGRRPFRDGSRQGSRGLVLAYDEDPVFLEALKRYLEGRGYAVAPTLSAGQGRRPRLDAPLRSGPPGRVGPGPDWARGLRSGYAPPKEWTSCRSS